MGGIPLFELLRDMGLVLDGSAGVSDDVESRIAVLGDDGVVNDTSLLVQKNGQGGGEWFERVEGRGTKAQEEFLGSRACKVVLQHMRDVK